MDEQRHSWIQELLESSVDTMKTDVKVVPERITVSDAVLTVMEDFIRDDVPYACTDVHLVEVRSS